MRKKRNSKRSDNSNPGKKLKSYSLAAASFLAVQPAVSAIVYTDIVPDTTLTDTAEYLLDIDNNGIDDFALKFYSDSLGHRASIARFSSNSILGYYSQWCFQAVPLSLNDTISNNQTVWNGSYYSAGLATFPHYYTGGCPGMWAGTTDKYLGVRILIGSDWHYGWIRMDIPLDVSSVTIKDYAYESSPNTGILAGATGVVGTSDPLLPDHISLHANNNILTIDFHETRLTDAQISIISINGQTVLEQELTGNKSGISLEGIKRGIYLAVIRSKEGFLTRKINIE